MIPTQIISSIQKKYPEDILDQTVFSEEDILHVRSSNIFDILTLFKDNKFNFLSDLTAIDNLTLGGVERFAVVYHLLSHETAERVTIKAYVSEDKPELPSAESLWKTADWQEREIYDLFGISFKGHPNLVRIMNPDNY